MALTYVRTVPILRSFDEAKAREFYIDWLGFVVDWEHRFEPGLPLYMQVSRDGIALHPRPAALGAVQRRSPRHDAHRPGEPGRRGPQRQRAARLRQAQGRSRPRDTEFDLKRGHAGPT